MSTISFPRTACIGIFLSSLTAAPAQAEDAPWRERVVQELPRLGHRNWIVIADAAYPLQSRAGIETIAVRENQLAALKYVLAALNASKHVRPVIYLDAELPHVPEEDAPGIAAHRKELTSLLKQHKPHSLPHEELIARLDKSAGTFHVLILKTDLQLPYTSVFIELDCAYWSPEAEQRLRESMKRPQNPSR